MKVKFFGAAGTVTGSSYLLTSDSGESILIDYGMFQGTEDRSAGFASEQAGDNFARLECDVSQLSGMVLTHAHLDHCGRMPRLVGQGFNKNIWMTPATHDITEISLYDTAKIAKNVKEGEILYGDREVDQIVNLFKTVEYEDKFSIGSFEIIMRDAGHILGSASLEIIDTSAKGKAKKIVFSGDLGNSPEDLIKPTEFVKDGDVVVIESTYGDKDHPEGKPSDSIQSEINVIEKQGGVLLIPSFSIERSQEILHIIYHLKKSGKIMPATPILFDSPMAEKVNQVFLRFPELYNDEFNSDFKSGNPFDFPGLIGKMATGGSMVVVAGAGMMTGGKIVNYAAQFLQLSTTRLLIVGYQGDKTLGREILTGAKTVSINALPVAVNATVNQIETMSSHAGQSQLLKWLKNINGVRKVFVTHGEDNQRKILSEKIRTELGINDVLLPLLNQEFEAL